MTTPLVVMLNGFEMTIDDPAEIDSWIRGLKPLINDLASDQPFSQYDRWDEISADDQKELGKAVYKAMLSYRAGVEGGRPFKDYVAFACADRWGDVNSEGLFYHYQKKPVDSLYSDLDEFMAEHEGPVADLDALSEALHEAVEDKIRDNDTSSPLDMFSGHCVRLTFNPFYNPEKGGVDDLMLQMSDLKDYLNGHEGQSLVNFFRLGRNDLIPLLGMDYKDTDGIRSVISTLKQFKHSLPPVITGKALQSLAEENGRSCVYPHWHGEVDFDDLLEMDPKKPLRLKGGVIAFLDIINGAGHYEALPDDSLLVIEPDQLPSPAQWRYDVYDCFDTSREYQATVCEFDTALHLEKQAEAKHLKATGDVDDMSAQF